jgi:copper(I)-binding protein
MMLAMILEAPVTIGQGGTPTASPAASPAAMSGTAAVFMTIANDGVEDDRLLGGRTDVARVVEVHEMADDEGMMRMRPLPDGLAVPAGGEATLEPGGIHMMLIGLTHDLVSGSTYELILEFERAGDVKVDVPVRPRAVGESEATTIDGLTISDLFSRPAPRIGEEMSMHQGMEGTPATPGP